MSSPEPYPPRPAPRGWDALVETVRDRAADPRMRLAGLLAVAFLVGFVWYQAGRSEPAALAAPKRASPSAHSRSTTTTTRPPVLVHVAGAVVRPGLVRIDTGARVADAIAAAGGGVDGADLDRLNLAAKVVDGQRILVARLGDPGSASDPSGLPTDAVGPADGAPIDLNTATVTTLDTLPGIGPTLAAAILRERDRRGGFTRVDQLRDVRGIGDARFADIRDLVTV